MSNRTKSENLFKQYAVELGYSIFEIPTQPDTANRTPDYRLNTPDIEIIAEVTELSPNDEDKRVEKNFREKRRSSWNTTPGRRLRAKIKNKLDQIRKFDKNLSIPYVVVIFDNRMIDGHYATHQNHHLEHEDLIQGLSGQSMIAIHFDEAGGIDHTEDRIAGNRTVRSDHGTVLSAVCIMTEDCKTKKIRMSTYHNVFASIELPTTVFSGLDDLHFKNPNFEASFLMRWDRVQEKT